MTKTTPKRSRQVPSVERQLALALVGVLECIGMVDVVKEQPGYSEMEASLTEAIRILGVNGYKDLESISSRVRRIEADIAEAVKSQDGAKLARLGAELDRAKAGKPPLATEKKPKKKTDPPAEKKDRKKKDDSALPLGEVVPVQCLSCPWEGTGTADSKCPECGNVVALDVTDESEAK